jgi:glycosyltransferase involved in cell wall biosynthesis
MRIYSKWEKGYNPLDKSTKKKSFFTKFCSIRILIIISVILLIILLTLKFFITKSKSSFFTKNEISLYEIFEPNEIIYQNNLLSETDINEINNIKNYINNLQLINPDKENKKYQNPKISIIIPVYNNGNFLEKSLISIYNQNFKEIEIIIIDDYSTDNSVSEINQLLSKFHSISFYKNEKNIGPLYCKIQGVLKSKGKYLLFLYPGDFFTKNDIFSTLYEQAEKDDLDMLGFSSLLNNGKYIHHYTEIELMNKNINNHIMYNVSKDYINRVGDVIFNYFIKGELLKTVVNEFDNEFLNEKNIKYNSDFFLLFLLGKNVKIFKQIKNIFYYSSKNWEEKWKESDLYMRCLNYINYLDFLFNKTNDDYFEKKIVVHELKNWILNTKCRKNDFIRDQATNLARLISEKKYVPNKYKKELFIFMFENITVIS